MKEFQRLLMTIILCISGSPFLFPAPNTQAAIYPGISGDNTHEWITNVTFGTINNSTLQDTNGYGDYTFDKSNFMTQVQPGITYPLSVTIQPDVDWCDENISVFFDWNHDNNFNDSGESFTVVSDTCDAGPHTVNIKVPSNTTGGETRMRVVLGYLHPPPNSGSIPEGEAEDYTLLISYPIVTGKNTDEWITNVTLGDFTNSTDEEQDGHGDYSLWVTGMITEVKEGELYPLSVTIYPDTLFCDDEQGYGENVSAFIDWNHDGDFTDSGEEVKIAVNTCAAEPPPVDFKVPHHADPGRTRMRIVVNWGYSPPSTGQVFGEGEDYSIFVIKKFNWPMFLPATINAKNKK